MGVDRRAGRRVRLALLLLVMAFILWNSSQSGPASDNYSAGLSELLASIVVPGFEGKSESERAAIVAAVNGPLRQFAHGFEFALLGALAMAYLRSLPADWGLRKQLLVTMIFCVAFACTDEVFQLFVDGRAFQVGDILTDAMGSLTGAVLILLIAERWGTREGNTQ